jgi:hypothetical protein
MANKYISFKQYGNGFTEIVIFPETIKHSEMKQNLGNIEIVGAGFISFSIQKDEYEDLITKFTCYGKSDSLGITSHENDSNVAQRLFGSEY